MDEKRLEEIERIVNEAYSPGPWNEMAELIAEVRRLRAEVARRADTAEARALRLAAEAVECRARARAHYERSKMAGHYGRRAEAESEWSAGQAEALRADVCEAEAAALRGR